MEVSEATAAVLSPSSVHAPGVVPTPQWIKIRSTLKKTRCPVYILNDVIILR